MGIMGEKMLLLSFNRMCRFTAFYLIFFLFLLFLPPVYASSEKVQQDIIDIIIKNKKNRDLLTSPPKAAKKRKLDDKITTTKTNASSSGVDSNTDRLAPEDPIKPDRDYLDVYVGRCQFTSDGIKSAKRFLANRRNYFAQYYMMKTKSDFTPNVSDMEGIEFYLPLDAQKYDITTVPAFILNVKGVTYKISGAADLDEVYREIENNLTRGEKKNGYIDLGERGKGCKAVIVDMRPSKLTAKQVEEVNAENHPPDMRGLIAKQAISLPQTSKPALITKQITPPAGSSRFIVFSEAQKEWAKKEFNSGTFGCCTDCNKLDGLWPYAQYCSNDMLKELGVSSVPTVVTFSPTKR